jgi:hypothetical protein
MIPFSGVQTRSPRRLATTAVFFFGLFALLPFARAQKISATDSELTLDGKTTDLFQLHPRWLAETKRRVDRDDPRLEPALEHLLAEAAKALEVGPFTVVHKKRLPPSGDPHDYMSVGPYWWPDPDKEDGLPYIRRDGEVNPERKTYDNVPMGRMEDAVETLTLAWFFTGEKDYSDRAVTLLRTFFLDPETRMNPHLNFGQAIPGRCEGRGIGIIDTASLSRTVDYFSLLEASPSMTDEDRRGMHAWFAEYLRWMQESKIGKQEARTKNNHITWYDVQRATYALYVENDDLARQVLQQVPKLRYFRQIEPDGRQPHELARTKAFSYSVMNLRGFFLLASLGRKVGLDLWHAESDDGRSIRQALDYLIPFALGEETFPYKQLGGVHGRSLAPLLRQAAWIYEEPRYRKAAETLLADSNRQERFRLLIPKPPADDHR